MFSIIINHHKIPQACYYSSVYFYIKFYISLKFLFLEDFKYKKIFFEYANFMLITPPIGSELSSKLKYPYLKNHYRFYFLTSFLAMVAR